MLNVMDIVTLDDDNSYIVLNVTELDGCLLYTSDAADD